MNGSGRKKMWAGVGAVAVVAAGVGTAVALAGGESGASADGPDLPLGTAEVVTTDLIEEASYDGTLGRTGGEAILSAREGTVTSVAEAGSEVGNGDVLYTVDGEPVVGLAGDTPAYRALTAYPEPVELAAPVEGVITWLPEPGTEIGPGDVVMRIDGLPVIAIVGDVPAYRDLRDLSENMTGADVLQLEQNLAELGLAEQYDVTVDEEFTTQTADALEALQAWLGADDDGALNLGEFVVIDAPTTVIDVPAEVGDSAGGGSEASAVLELAHGARLSGPDVGQLNTALIELGYLAADAVEAAPDEFGAATDAAVRELQAALGMDVDGTLDLDEFRFLAGDVRVASVEAPVGTALTPGTQVLTVTGRDIVVTVDLPAEDQGTFAVDDAVTVELPDGTQLDAWITSVATVAEVSDGAAVFPVEIALADPAAAGNLDEAPVDVTYVGDSALGVTAVPVAALVALREGGYAVEVADDPATGATHLVGVTAGFFADGLVEVSGDLEPGDLVVVP